MRSLFLSLFLAFFAINAFAQPFNKIIFFGDSLSDNGNDYKLSSGQYPASPPYYEGRFSNGLVWSDIFADYFQQKYGITAKNYAYGGATVLPHGPSTFPPDLYREFGQFTVDSVIQDKSKMLFVMMIGGNDYVDVDVDETTTKVVNTISSVIQALIDNHTHRQYGAKYFLIFNMPDLSKAPYAKIEPYGPKLHDMALKHNQKLEDAIANLRQANPDVTFTVVDLFALFDDLTLHPDVYNQKYHQHLTNFTDPCWLGGYTSAKSQKFSSPQLKVAAANAAYPSDDNLCATPDDYFFWDHTHPSAVAHNIIAHEVIAQIDP